MSSLIVSCNTSRISTNGRLNKNVYSGVFETPCCSISLLFWMRYSPRTRRGLGGLSSCYRHGQLTNTPSNKIRRIVRMVYALLLRNDRHPIKKMRHNLLIHVSSNRGAAGTDLGGGGGGGGSCSGGVSTGGVCS